ncbi:MAG: hypothetical protein M0R06_14475 [Sphaerochaeta sp.]|nr:hypothetical protein [Sphaerochaeta sp.]
MFKQSQVIQMSELERLTRRLHKEFNALQRTIAQIEYYRETNPTAGIPETPVFVVSVFEWVRAIERIAQEAA